MDKYEIATKIGFVLVAKGAATFGRIVLKGSDKALVSEFGNMFKGMSVVVDGLNNMIFGYVTSMRGKVQKALSVVNGVVYHGMGMQMTGLALHLAHVASVESYQFLVSQKECK